MQVKAMSGAALAAAIMFTSGCGGASSSTSASSPPAAPFKASFATAVNQLRATSRSIGTSIQQASSETDAQIGTVFQALATRWQSQVSQLEVLRPPSNLGADFNALTGAASRVTADLNGVVAAAGRHSSTAASKAAASIVTDITTAKSASTRLTQKLGIN